AMPEILEAVLANAAAAASRYVPEESRAGETRQLVATVYEALKAAPQGDLQIIWARALIGLADDPEHLALLGRLADGAETIEGLTIDQDMRWSIAVKHVAHGIAG